jgi:hypothetical protein
MASLGNQKRRLSELGSDEVHRWKSWLEEVERPLAILTPTFEIDFNLEYWSCQLFGGSAREAKKIHEILDVVGKVLGRIEVGAYAGMNLEPFDRLMMLALIQLWYDQGGDPQGRIAFSYRALFRRLGLKAGGRQSQQVKNALDRLRRCFITLTNCFMTRTEKGDIVPVEAEADPFTILKLKQTATLGSGRETQRLVVCQLSSIVMSGLTESGRLRPRIHSGILQKLRAKNSIAILLHGYYNGRMWMGEERFFEYKALGLELRIKEQFHSNLVNRLLSPHEKLEKIGAIKIAEHKKSRRGKGLTITLLAPPGEDEAKPTISIQVGREPKRVPLDSKDKDQIPLFEETVASYDEQLLLAFRAAGVKNIKFLLRKYGKNIDERALWALLENVREKNADEKWEWRRGPDAYVAKCLNDGYYIPEDYKTPKERFKDIQDKEVERAQILEAEETAKNELEHRKQAAFESLDKQSQTALEETAIARMLEECQGLRGLLKKDAKAGASAPIEERYRGLSNSIVKDAYKKQFNKILLELAS